MRRRPFRWSIALIVWVLVAVAPAQAASPGTVTADGLTTATGMLQVVHADDFAHDRATFAYSLRMSSGSLELDFPEAGPMDEGGATVQVTGRISGGHLHVATDTPGHGLRIVKEAVPLFRTDAPTFHHDATGIDVPGVPSGATGAAATDPQLVPQALAAASKPVSVAVVLLNFSNDARQAPSPAAATGMMFANPDSVANFFAEESRGAISITGQVFGWYTIAATNANCAYATWQSEAAAAAQAAGVDLNAYDHIVFAWPRAISCGWAGMGWMPGPITWNNGSFDLRVLAHELSHNFGTNHASTLQCTQGATIVAISATCSYDEYGDPFSVMGSGSTYHNDGEQLSEIGFLLAGELATVVPGGTYTLTPLLGSPAGLVKVLRIVRQTGTSGTSFYLDVRATFGPYFDSFGAGSAAVTGVMIRLSSDTGAPTRSPTNTKLIDTTPATSTYLDAPLAVGQTLTDPVSHISITTVSLDASGATVRVTESVPPSAPVGLSGVPAGASAADLAWSAATDNVAVAGYRVGRDGVDVATLAASARGYHDTGLTAETGYQYTVVAFDGSANDGPVASVSVTTTPNDKIPPTAPTGLAATPSAATVKLVWAAGTDDQAVAGYRISRNGAVVATVTGTTWTDTHRTPKTAYAYDVVTLDRAANPSPVSSVAVVTLADTTAPTAPKGLKAVRWHSKYTALSWRAATDDVGVKGYHIYRVGTTRWIATTTLLTLHVKRVAGARYYVRAFDAAGHTGARTFLARAL
jgi:chitodextrinase